MTSAEVISYVVRIFRHGVKPRRELLQEVDCGTDRKLTRELALRTLGPKQTAQIIEMRITVLEEIEMPLGRCWFCVDMVLPCAQCQKPIAGMLDRPMPPEGSGCVFCDLGRPHGVNPCAAYET